MLRGYSASLINPSSHIERRLTRSWAELNAFFEAEKESSEGRSYKNNISGQMQEYRGWVFSAIDCITDRICSLNYQFYMKDSGEQFLPTSAAYTAITKPIMNPNKNMTFRFIKQWCQIQLDLCGKAAILKLRNQLGMPWELWPLDMNYFDGLVFPKNASFITPPLGYAFKFGNNRRVLPARDIIWLRYPHPTDLWSGFSPIQAQAYATDVDHYIEVYERNFFKNSARVDFIIQAKDSNIDEDTAKRIKEQWVTKYGGIKRSYEPAVLSGGLEIVPITMTAKDFQFMELAGWSKDKVLSAYRVPEGKLGLFRDINRANQKGIDIAFNEEAIAPRLTLWDDEITKQLIEEFTDKIVVKHDNPVPRDREIDLEELKLRTGGVGINTIDEARNWWDGSKGVPGGNQLLIDQKFIPLTDAGKKQEAERQGAGGEGGGKPDASDKPGKDDDTPEYDQEHDPGGEESEKIASRNYLLTLQVYKKVLAHTKGWSYEKSREKALEYCEKFNVPIDMVKTFVYCASRDLPIERFKQEMLEELITKVAYKIRR